MFKHLVCRLAALVLALVSLALAAIVIIPSVSEIQLLAIDTGSMEPSISVDDVVAIVPVDDVSSLSEGDVIAYGHNGTLVVHRVITNRTSLGEIVTKGDANDYEDLEPVPYESVAGKSTVVIPQAKTILDIITSPMGKVYILIAAACSVLLWVRAGQIRRNMYHEKATNTRDQRGADGSVRTSGQKRHKHGALGIALRVSLIIVFVVSAGLVIRYRMNQKTSVDTIRDAVSDYVRETGAQESEDLPPFSVDFEAMRAVNPDVVGWIRCEGTPIDFPVVKGDDNKWYLRRNWKGEQDMCGSIFVDADASDGFTDARTIIYGHHMNDNLMFACLEDWDSQAYYEQHPVMWLLTPEHTYRLDLLAGEHIPATSDAYVPAKNYDEAFMQWLTTYIAESDFESNLAPSEQDRYVMLSTCAYVFDNARYTILCRLTAIN